LKVEKKQKAIRKEKITVDTELKMAYNIISK
jgi:hypothetical protein